MKNYIAIVKLKDGDVLWPEVIEGNTKDVNAVLTLKGHKKNGEEWEVEVLRSECATIKKQMSEEIEQDEAPL